MITIEKLNTNNYSSRIRNRATKWKENTRKTKKLLECANEAEGI